MKNKVCDALCDVVCLQETKKDSFDTTFLKKICPASIDSFEFLPSVGASRGILVAWKSAMFDGEQTFCNEFAISVQLTSKHDRSSWVITSVYGPYTPEGKIVFTNWLKNFQSSVNSNWMILGDFNLIRKPEDRNKPGGDLAEMFRFNSAISSLGLNEVKLQGKRYTWSNMQPSPLLEKLDWIFTSACWINAFPNTTAKALDMVPSDHRPCLISVSTRIPKSRIFRFENSWLMHADFQNILSSSWNQATNLADSAKNLTAKYKGLRKNLRDWQASITSLKTQITNIRLVIFFLEVLAEYRDLSLEEWNFKEILDRHLMRILEKQKLYWKQRRNIKWATLGDARTHFFTQVQP